MEFILVRQVSSIILQVVVWFFIIALPVTFAQHLSLTVPYSTVQFYLSDNIHPGGRPKHVLTSLLNSSLNCTALFALSVVIPNRLPIFSQGLCRQCSMITLVAVGIESLPSSNKSSNQAIYNAGRTRFAALHNFRYFRQLSNVISK